MVYISSFQMLIRKLLVVYYKMHKMSTKDQDFNVRLHKETKKPDIDENVYFFIYIQEGG